MERKNVKNAREEAKTTLTFLLMDCFRPINFDRTKCVGAVSVL